MRDFLCDLFNLFQPLKEKVMKYNYLSFDIFDTLVIRKCGSPHNVFRLVEDRFNSTHIENISDFYNKRIHAEIMARETVAKAEITLDDIYEKLNAMYGENVANELKKLEIETEYEQCTARKEIVSIFNDVVENKDVVIASDMYLPFDIVEGILQINKIKIPKLILVSSECQVTKSAGTMFTLIPQKFNCKPQDILHIGDNWGSDFLRPRLMGINSYILKKSKYEKL